MMKKILIILLGIALTTELVAQQLPQITNYMLNEYAINPAVAGTKDNINLVSVNRYQWEEIKDGPRTYTLSFHSPLKNNRSGVGAYLYTDIVGPSRRIGLQGSYAYHLQLTEDLNLSLALSAGLLQYSIDGHKLHLIESNDPVLENALGSKILFDTKFGAYLFSDRYYVGVSLPQIAHNRLKVYEGMAEAESFLSTHYFVNAGYMLPIGEDFELQPTVLLKYVDPVPLKIDVNAKIIYQNKLWFGGGWRSNDAINILLGYNWNDAIQFGYSHDYTTSDLSSYVGSTHEIMLGIKINRKD